MKILEDPVGEALYGLFLKVKDSPRHIAIKAENLINEVFHVCALFSKDRKPEEHLKLYAHQIEQDLGWHYAAELVMPMAYGVCRLLERKSKKNERLLSAIEQNYQCSCYWQTFLAMKPQPTDLTAAILKMKQNSNKPIIIHVGQADINLYSGGNIIGNNIKYGNE